MLEGQPMPPEQSQANVSAPQSNIAGLSSLPPRVFLSKEELAAWLGVGDTTIEKWMRQRVIPVSKIGPKIRLFNVVSVVQALERFTVKAVGGSQKM